MNDCLENLMQMWQHIRRSKMNKTYDTFCEEKGQAMVEYTLILTVILLGAMLFFGGTLGPQIVDGINATMGEISTHLRST